MKENQKIVEYHLDSSKPTDEAFLKEVERIKVSGKRLTNAQKAKLLKIAKPLVYK
jgi:hypothetical protein